MSLAIERQRKNAWILHISINEEDCIRRPGSHLTVLQFQQAIVNWPRAPSSARKISGSGTGKGPAMCTSVWSRGIPSRAAAPGAHLTETFQGALLNDQKPHHRFSTRPTPTSASTLRPIP
jgi:hypothetical protein